MARLDQARRQRIEAALNAGDMAGALALADRAIADGVRDPLLFNLVAWRAEEAFDFAAAHAALAQALALAPDDATIVTAAGRALRKEGRTGDACAMLDRAARLDPAFAVPWLERGYALDAAGETRGALANYRRAADLDPRLAPAFAGAAAMAARLGDGTAAALARQALALDPAEPIASATLATADSAAGDHDGAIGRLTTLLSRPGLAAEGRIAALTALGDACDRAGRPDAFAAWSAAKAQFAELHAPRFVAQESQRAFIDRIAAAVAATDSAAWATRAPTIPAAGHVFLIGYPRSGTTLVENILASAPDVVALEERPTFTDADPLLLRADGIDELLALDDAALDRLRAAYWARVAAAGADVAGKVFVDMDPLKGIKLPLIARLFPAARVVIVRRDPRDVVLSCFRQNFRVSAAAFAFTSLVETACHYAALMALTECCMSHLPLTTHTVRYDALVADFDATTRALCDFADVAWSDDLRRFDRTAARRGVTTASAGQVERGLYDGGGRWRRYAAQLAPVLPILAPWLERFGFEPHVAPAAAAG